MGALVCLLLLNAIKYQAPQLLLSLAATLDLYFLCGAIVGIVHLGVGSMCGVYVYIIIRDIYSIK